MGRDRLRDQIEVQFNRQFAGSLEIERLRGNLVNDLYASDVRVLDPTGNDVISIDSVTVRPRWLQLLTRELSIRSITLHRPSITAHRDASGRWSLQKALHRVRPSTAETRIGITAADIRIENGRFTTTRDGSPPDAVRSDWLFDYTRAGIEDFNAQGTVDWSGREKLIEVYDVTFDVPDADLSFSAVQGQIVRENDTWTVRQTRVSTGATDLRMSGSITMTEHGEPNVDVTLAESRIDFNEVSRVVPRVPLRDLVTVNGRIIGPPSGFLLDTFQIRHGSSRLSIQGTALGLPDSLDYDIRVQDARLRRSDVETVLNQPLPDRVAALNNVEMSFFSRGVIDLTGDPSAPFDVSASLTASTDIGDAQGDLAVQRKRNAAIQYSAELDVDRLDLAPLTKRDALGGRINGRLTGTGRGATVDSLDTDVTLELSESRIGDQQLDSARVNVIVTGRAGRGTVMIEQAGGGRLDLDARFDATGERSEYGLTIATTAFDLEPLPGSLPSSSLFAQVQSEGHFQGYADASGSLTLDVDSSQIAPHDSLRLLRPHRLTVDLTRPDADNQQRLQVDGSVLNLTARGTLNARVLPALARHWGSQLATGAREAADKPMPQTLAVTGSDLPPSARPKTASTPADGLLSSSEDVPLPSRRARRDSVRELMAEAGIDGQAELGVTATIRDASILQLWLPALPPLSDGLSSSMHAQADADTINVQGTLQADRYTFNQTRIDSLSAGLTLNASMDRPLVESTATRLEVVAHSAAVGSLSVATPRLSFQYKEREGDFRVTTDRKGRAGPFVLATGIRILPSRNVINVRDLSAAIGDISWSHPGTSTIDVYSDGVIVEPLVVESLRPQEGGLQKISVSGRLTPRDQDRLVARAENVLLYPVSDLLKLKRPVAGRLDGEIEMSGKWTEPVVRTNLNIGRFSVDRRLLGAIGLSATYDTRSPDVAMQLTVRPDTATSGPTLVPGGIRTVEDNTLSLNGRVRLPISGADTLAGDPLDLKLSVQRADLFFFEYIFQDTITKVSGYTAGQAHIGGSFTDPLFDADMRVADGDFTLPRFNLDYDIAGDVMVDEAGIHLAGVRVEDSDDGVADIDGSILFNEYRFFSFDLAAQLREMMVIDVEDSDDLPFYGTIRASGPASLTGPLSDATLRSPGARTTPDSELFIPVLEEDVSEESGYIIFADSTGQLPDLRDLTRRDNLLSDRPVGEPSFLDGLELDLNILAPEGSTVHLVFDPLVGDVVTAIGSGRVQLQRQEGEFFVYGTYEVEGGDYLFTAGEVFVRRFSIDGGTLTWDGDPVNASMNLSAAYRTRASPAGLPNEEQYAGRIPVIVELDITGRVETPRVDLSLSVARDQRSGLVGDQTLDAILNQDDLATEYATSVLLTNTFLLTTSTLTTGGASSEQQSRIAEAGNQLAFNSVSQLVASQLNRYLSEALPNVDVNLGVSGEDPEDLDIIYGVALRLLNERLIIRGEGVYTGNEPDQPEASGPQGEFVVEVRLSRTVSVEVFYRRAGDDVTRQTLTNTTGAGLSYQTEFPTWKHLFYQLFGWLLPGDGPQPDTDDAPSPDDQDPSEAVAGREDE